jgi:VIT1/CCC1 family predicted Fe2+/Mn2+ transporter
MSTDKPIKHFTASDSVRDVVIGMSDGLTVPFALAAGLTGAVAASHLVITAGLAEIVAGSISMGLGGFLAAKSDIEHYHRERAVEESEVKATPEQEAQEVRDILAGYGLTKEQSEPVVDSFRTNHEAWINFMMHNELGLKQPSASRARNSALTIAAAYAIGGIVPLSPYFFVHNAHHALLPSVIVTFIALLAFGYFRAKVSGGHTLKTALQTVLVGGIAATAAFILAKAISG